MAVRGGHKLRALLKNAAKADGVDRIRVGFFKDAKYPDGTPVAAVAAWQEFGTRRKGKPHIPERPFIRRTLARTRDDVRELLAEGIDTEKMTVDTGLAGRIGAFVAGQIQKEIVQGDFDALAESTLAARRKRGVNRTRPLVDTGTMRTAVSYETREKGALTRTKSKVAGK